MTDQHSMSSKKMKKTNMAVFESVQARSLFTVFGIASLHKRSQHQVTHWVSIHMQRSRTTHLPESLSVRVRHQTTSAFEIHNSFDPQNTVFALCPINQPISQWWALRGCLPLALACLRPIDSMID
jgi:hypothetical protein